MLFRSQSNPDDTHTAAQKCATDLKLDWDKLSTCADGPEGVKSIAANKKKTDALNPPHQYVPWVLINGVHTEAMENKVLANLEGYLCQNYLNKDNIPECKNAFGQETVPAQRCFRKGFVGGVCW